MKFNKIFIMASVAMLALFNAACSSDDDYSAGQPTNADSLNVYFQIENSTIAIPVDGSSFDVTYARNNTNGELTIPVNFQTSTPEIFPSVPQNVTFKNGEKTATITITCKEDMKMFHNYRAVLTIDEKYTTQYADTSINIPRAELVVVKEDYKPYCKGKYTSAWTEEAEDAVLEYSEMQKTYRFNRQTSGEFTFYFTIGEVINNPQSEFNGMSPITFDDSFTASGSSTQWSHPTYGAVTMVGADAKVSAYDPSEKTYYFDIEFTVAAGSFGDYYDTFEAE